MRISHVIHTFPPHSRAGSENYLEALALEQSRWHDVSVFHRVSALERPEYEVTEDTFNGLPVTRINRTFRDFEGFRDTYLSEPVANSFGLYLDRFRPDVVHFHHITTLSTSCVREAKDRGITVVFTLHDFWLFCPRGQLLRRDLSLCERHSSADCVRCVALQLPIGGGEAQVRQLWERSHRLRRLRLPADLHRRFSSFPFGREREAIEEIEARNRHVLEMCELVDKFVSPSRFLRDRAVDLGLRSAKITVLDNGYDLSRWSASEAVPATSDDGRLRFGFLGTWIPSKGLHVLIRAFSKLDPSRAFLDIHGYAVPYDGVENYEDQLRQLVGNAPHIRLHGRYSPEDVPRLLRGIDVLVVPSIWYENSPLTIHEAFLARVPVVAAGHGGMKEHVKHGVNGLNFRPGSYQSLRRALRRLVKDRSLVDRLRRGIRRVQGIEEHTAELESLYRAAAGTQSATACLSDRDSSGHILVRGDG